MPAAHPDRPADRFALFLNALVRAVADSFPKGQQGQLLLWQRLMHLGARFTAILAASRRPRAQRPPSPRPATPPIEPPPKSPPRSPQPDFGLLFRQLPGYEKHRSQMESLLQEPGIAQLLQATPQLRRVLNPLCRMLNLQPLPPPPPGPQTPDPQTPGPEPANPPASRQSRPERRLTPGLFASPAQAQPVPRSCGPPPPPSLWSQILRELERRKLRAANSAPPKPRRLKPGDASITHAHAETGTTSPQGAMRSGSAPSRRPNPAD